MEFLGNLIWQIGKNGQTFIDHALKKYGIGSSQLRIIRALYDTEGISQEKITKILGVDKAATAKSVKKLLTEGYIERKTDGKDKRMYRVTLSEKAVRIKDEMRDILLDWQRVLLRGFTDQESAEVHKLLMKMADNSNQLAPSSDRKR